MTQVKFTATRQARCWLTSCLGLKMPTTGGRLAVDGAEQRNEIVAAKFFIRDHTPGRKAHDVIIDRGFKPLRLQNGHLQLHAYMLRVAIPMARCPACRCAGWPALPVISTANLSRRRTFWIADVG